MNRRAVRRAVTISTQLRLIWTAFLSLPAEAMMVRLSRCRLCRRLAMRRRGARRAPSRVPAAMSTSASTGWRIRCASSPARSSSCSTATSSSRADSRCRRHAGRGAHDRVAAGRAAAPARAECPDAAAARRPVSRRRWPPAPGRRRGRRADVFDPAQHPSAPGAPRPLGARAARRRRPRMPAPSRAAPALRRARRRRAARSRPCMSGQRAATRPGPRCRRRRVTQPRRRRARWRSAAVAAPKDTYDLAYGYLLRKDYALGRGHLPSFLQDIRATASPPRRNYWLGESLFQRQNIDAAEAFLDVYEQIPASAKAPGGAAAARPVARGDRQKELPAPRSAKSAANIRSASRTVKQGVEREQKRVRC